MDRCTIQLLKILQKVFPPMLFKGSQTCETSREPGLHTQQGHNAANNQNLHVKNQADCKAQHSTINNSVDPVIEQTSSTKLLQNLCLSEIVRSVSGTQQPRSSSMNKVAQVLLGPCRSRWLKAATKNH